MSSAASTSVGGLPWSRQICQCVPKHHRCRKLCMHLICLRLQAYHCTRAGPVELYRIHKFGTFDPSVPYPHHLWRRQSSTQTYSGGNPCWRSLQWSLVLSQNHNRDTHTPHICMSFFHMSSITRAYHDLLITNRFWSRSAVEFLVGDLATHICNAHRSRSRVRLSCT